MKPPFTTARLTLIAIAVFVLTFVLSAATVSALQDEPQATLGPDVAVAILPLDGGPPVTTGPDRLLRGPGAAATAAVAPALAAELLTAGRLSGRERRGLLVAVADPADAGATDALGDALDARAGDPAAARVALARTAGVAASTAPFRELGWPAVAQARFLARLARRCLVPEPEAVLDPLAAAGARQAWGLGTLRDQRAGGSCSAVPPSRRGRRGSRARAAT